MRRSTSDVRLGGQLEVDLLERGPRDLEALEPLAARERVARQPVQQRRSGRRSGARTRLPSRQVRDAVARELPAPSSVRRALGDDPARP